MRDFIGGKRLAVLAIGLLICIPLASLSEGRSETLKGSLSTGVIQLDIPEEGHGVVQQLEIETGKSVLIRTSYSVKRVSVGNPEILDVVVLGSRELQLVAKSIGTTNMLIWDKTGKPQAAIDIHVGAPYSRLQSELRRILGSDDISVDNAGNGIVLKGSVSSAVAMEQTLAVARAVLSDEGSEAKKIVNLMEVRGHQQVMLKVVIAEMARTVRMEFGTNLNALIDTGGESYQVFTFVQGLTSAGEGVVQAGDMVNLIGSFSGLGALANLQVFLDILDSKGLSKILAEPTLVARSGETASFLSGGQVPIPVAQGGAAQGAITIEYKDFGVGVQFTPTVLGPNRIHLEVRPEVSEPDFSFGTQIEGIVVPGFNTRRASTAVELGDGQSFAIAGLLRDDIVGLTDAYPILGQIPVIGALVRSSQFQKRQTELVIIVTPHLVKPLSPDQLSLPTDHFVEPTKVEFYFLGALEGRVAVADAAAEPGPDTGEAAETATSVTFIGDVGHRISALDEETD